jgi:DNA-binding SARP family transcriptional activator
MSSWFSEEETGMDGHGPRGDSEKPFPQLRIWLCGPFKMEWVDPLSGEILPPSETKTGGRDQAAALSLLALLLCQPNRQAHRDWVMEQFWPEGSRSVALHRLENIFSCLRKLLRSPSGGESLARSLSGKKTSGPLYCLDAYPRLWVDLDALVWQVEQAARMERFGDDALPFWQRAFELAKRGPFLVDNPYDPYASWIIEQRERLEGYSRQCVHAIARLYLAEHGESGEAEALLLLRTYWQSHPTDEDALRPLMELLGKQERYQEAEDYYQQCLKTLDTIQRERQPDPRTQDIRKFLQTRQIQRENRSLNTIGITQNSQAMVVYHSKQQDPLLINSSPIITQDMLETLRTLEASSDVKIFDENRRRAILAQLLGIPPDCFDAKRSVVDMLIDTMNLQQETLSSLYEDMLIMGWDSFRRSKSPAIIVKIEEHVHKLAILTLDSSTKDADQWQSLLCRFTQLSTRIAQHRHDVPGALQRAKKAIMLAIDLDQAELIASAFYGRGRVHMEYSNTATNALQKRKHFERAKADIDAALGHVERVRAPLAGNIYLLAAEIYASIAGNDSTLRTQCEKWQDQVELLVANEPLEDDGTFLQLNKTALHHERAKTLLRFGQIDEARRELQAAWETLQPNLFTWHMNMNLTQATLSLAEHEIEESTHASIKAYKLAKTIQSYKGEVEVRTQLEQLQQLDKNHPAIRTIATTLGRD